MSSRPHRSKRNLDVDELTEKENDLEARLVLLRAQQQQLRNSKPVVAPVGHTAPSKQYEPGDVLKEEYRFIRSEQDNAEAEASWEKTIAKDYHDKLFKEYALADLSRYQEGKIGLRWRLEREVRSGKGETSCGNKECEAKSGLVKYEVPFSYVEAGEPKLALVKVTMCPDCAEKLQYKSKHPVVDEPRPSNGSKKRPRDRVQEADAEIEETETKRAKSSTSSS